ncbi:MAG TPA: GHMP kinase [Candidatus Marinimicrobia bacterium]|nr:GHMP kinase [Candidatus Neomarinimicrobiota bacterium]
MVNLEKQIKISAPGRICLFGEHQDYLDLPVIPMAINLRVHIVATPRNDKYFYILLPDIGEKEVLDFSKNKELAYTKKGDYFKSIYNVLYRKGVRFLTGFDCEIKGKIPINSGTSSSSALNNIWCKFLLEIGENVKKEWKEPDKVGYFSYQAEVVEFNEVGGMMDQLSTSIGNLNYIDFSNNCKITPIPSKLSTFVLGDSLQSKDTQKILSRTKLPALSAKCKINSSGFHFCYKNTRVEEIVIYKNLITEKEFRILRAMLKNRNITFQALKLLNTENIDHKAIGKLLTEHHKYLDKSLQISTPKLNKMIKAAINAGAYGGKINGSGGGGCMFAYAPENPQKVANAIENVGGKSYIVKMGNGLKIENL